MQTQKTTKYTFAKYRLKLPSTRYAIRGHLAISLHIGKRLGPYRETVNAAQPEPPNGKREPGETRKRETRTSRNSIATSLRFISTRSMFFSSRNASTHHDMMIRTPPPFLARSRQTRPAVPDFPVPVARFRLCGFTNDLKSTVSIVAQVLAPSRRGAGACVRPRFFHYHHSPTTFFAISSPAYRVWRRCLYSNAFLCFCVSVLLCCTFDRSSISVASCSLLEVFVGVVRP